MGVGETKPYSGEVKLHMPSTVAVQGLNVICWTQENSISHIPGATGKNKPNALEGRRTREPSNCVHTLCGSEQAIWARCVSGSSTENWGQCGICLEIRCCIRAWLCWAGWMAGFWTQFHALKTQTTSLLSATRDSSWIVSNNVTSDLLQQTE